MTVPTPARARPTARVLLLDAAGRVLLMSHGDKDQAWISPGGAVEPGESLPEAAVLELAEETGLVVDPADLLGPVLRLRVLWSAGRGTWYDGDDNFFVLRADPFEVSAAGRTALEQRIIGEARWWSAADVRAATDPVFPECLADLLDALRRYPDWVDAVAVGRILGAA
ncbi:MAG TPA: NUDIX domain-containing protein [Mycobacteriales bacterium]|nr:NUDIX domain-containing protein [Mycobacteriales bacterium]